MGWEKKKKINHFKIRSCEYKIKYETLKKGLIALLKRRDDEGWSIDSVYKCLFCEYYHLGHKKKKTRKRFNQIIKLIGNLKQEE